MNWGIWLPLCIDWVLTLELNNHVLECLIEHYQRSVNKGVEIFPTASHWLVMLSYFIYWFWRLCFTVISYFVLWLFIFLSYNAKVQICHNTHYLLSTNMHALLYPCEPQMIISSDSVNHSWNICGVWVFWGKLCSALPPSQVNSVRSLTLL